MSTRQKTDGSVLPQHCPLEALTADTPGQARNGFAQTAGTQHSRGEPAWHASYAALPPTASARGECGVSRVFVLAKGGKPLMPTTPARARMLLRKKHAVVHKKAPFTIRLKNRREGECQDVALKIDPGSKMTGFAMLRRDSKVHQTVVHLSELQHRGNAIRKKMQQRANYRRRRRSANLPYRAPRFNNRRRTRGWLAPSIDSRVRQIRAWVGRYTQLAPVSHLSIEKVRFDTQRLECPEITGVAYQRGELHGYEIREYLLEKWKRTCAYCHATNVPLEIDHILARAKGGSDRVSNLTIACRPCNQRKGATDVHTFASKHPKRLAKILLTAKAPLRDAAAVNAARNKLSRELSHFGLPLETATGGRTKYNRSKLNIPKTHALDAACVGEVKELAGWRQPVLSIGATGRGSYQRTRVTAHGFPRGILTRFKTIRGFRTGDLVRARVPTGKKQGSYKGRVAVRASGSFNIQTPAGVVQGISYRHCELVQRADGYAYGLARKVEPPSRGDFLRPLKQAVSVS